MDLAKDAWKSICFVPHHVVRNASQVFLVLLGEAYAVRLWPAHLCPTGLGGLEQATASARRWVFDIAETWNWVVVTNVSEWRVIPTKWVANTHDTARFGFIAAEELRGGVAHVPVVAEALVQVRHREAKAFRKEISFLTPPSVATSSRDGVDLPGSGNPRKTQQEYELAAINTWMDGHPLREEYLTRLKALHKKQQSRCKRKADKPDCDADASESASSQESQVEDVHKAALTFSCLAGLDEGNRQEYAKHTGTKGLMALEGVKRLARQIVRNDREAFRERDGNRASQIVRKDREAFREEANRDGNRASCLPLTGLQRVKCNLSWAKVFVLGSEESKVTLPSATVQSCLHHPPGRDSWVARFRHPKLIELRKRPTRSKSHKASDVSEHAAFQIPLRWLWERYELACKLCGHSCGERPAIVVKALEKCDACADGSCNFMLDLASSATDAVGTSHGGPQDVESDAGSIFSVGGTSETESSVPDHAPSRIRAASVTTPGQTGGHGGEPRSKEKPSLLLLGDSNASGYCETQPPAKSLRRRLESEFVVVSAGKTGASWKVMSKGVEKHLEQCEACPIITGRKYEYIVMVLGTNDVPMVSRWGSKQEKVLQDAFATVLEALKSYIIPEGYTSASGECSKRLLVTQPFNFEEKRAVAQFNDLLRQAVIEAGGTHVAVPWEQSKHVQSRTATPLKHFNEQGVDLLAGCVFAAIGRTHPSMGSLDSDNKRGTSSRRPNKSE